MTREDAIAYGNRVIDLGLNDETQAFCELAPEALEQQPCDDCISRQAVMKKQMLLWDEFGNGHKCVLAEHIEQLPPVTPQPKVGHWRHYEGMLICSECGAEFYDDIMEYCGDDVPKNCPNCGAKMLQTDSEKE